MLKLRLLGNAALEHQTSSIAGRAVQPRRIALLAVLGLAPRRSVSRDKLVALLWPESDTEQARHLLSVAVYELRKALGESVIITSREEVTLSADLAIDAVEFDQAVAAADYQRAVGLYGGPLLDGFHISDAPDFEHWVDGERSHLARRYAEALEKLAHEREAHGDRAGALAAWRKLVAHDPYSARSVCGLMLALEATGDRTGALQQARAHGVLLREEFGAQPDPDVEALAARLRSSPRNAAVPAPPLRTPPAPPTPLAGPATPRTHKRYIGGAAVALVAVVGLLFWLARGRGDKGPPAMPAIAVLPFVNVSATDSTAIFSDGLSDEIINALSRVSWIRVASRNSAFVFRGPRDVREVARLLGVDHVLEGTVRVAGARIKVTAQLVSAGDGLEVWSEEYDRAVQMADLISMQEEIAQAVVGALAARFDQDMPAPRLVHTSTDDVQAFELFVAGRHFYHRRTVPDLQRALLYFDSAIARDPNYALAHASKAEVYALLGAYDYGALPPRVAFAAARTAAERALAIDPNLAEAHNALASVLFNYEWDWAAAEREFRRAIELSPGYAIAHHWYSLLLHCAGREREALQTVMRARELDPLSPVIGTALARHYYLAGRLDDATLVLKRIVAADSTFVTAHVALGLSLSAHADYRGAIEQYQAAERMLGMRTPLIDGLLANAYGRSGLRDQALAHLASVKRTAAQRYVPAEYLALAYIGLGDHDGAFAALEQALSHRSAGLAYLEIEPLVDPLRDDPRLARLLAKIRAARK